MDFDKIKLEIYTPVEALGDISAVIEEAGINKINGIEGSFTYTVVISRWKDSTQEGTIKEASELKVETVCNKENVQRIIASIKSVHPYEEPLIYKIPILN